MHGTTMKIFKTLRMNFIAIDVFSLQAQTFWLAKISQPFIRHHSVGNCFCRLEERKLAINEKIEISCKVILNTDTEYNVTLLIPLLRFNC
jgi:hypothetical protein